MQKTFKQKVQELVDSGEIYLIIDRVFSASDIVRLLGYTVSGDRTKNINEIVLQCDADTSHWRINGKKPVEIVKIECPVCGKLFSFPAYEPKTTCSHSCANTYFRSGKNHPNWKGEDSKSYRKKALDHYGTFCDECGITNTLVLDVHHKDKDKTNNSMDNLQVLCCNCHAIAHRTH